MSGVPNNVELDSYAEIFDIVDDVLDDEGMSLLNNFYHFSFRNCGNDIDEVKAFLNENLPNKQMQLVFMRIAVDYVVNCIFNGDDVKEDFFQKHWEDLEEWTEGQLRKGENVKTFKDCIPFIDGVVQDYRMADTKLHYHYHFPSEKSTNLPNAMLKTIINTQTVGINEYDAIVFLDVFKEIIKSLDYKGESPEQYFELNETHIDIIERMGTENEVEIAELKEKFKDFVFDYDGMHFSFV